MSEFYFHTTLLHQAIRDNEHFKVQNLIKEGANILEKDDDGVTPYELAEILNNEKIIHILKNIDK